MTLRYYISNQRKQTIKYRIVWTKYTTLTCLWYLLCLLAALLCFLRCSCLLRRYACLPARPAGPYAAARLACSVACLLALLAFLLAALRVAPTLLRSLHSCWLLHACAACCAGGGTSWDLDASSRAEQWRRPAAATQAQPDDRHPKLQSPKP
jgi:hypothetical protein